ncbi:MAG: hypothetical protein KDA54_21255 [Phycisphaerales bacterium]|nr:hypothetical protein [Phycisphaerales bacterium]
MSRLRSHLREYIALPAVLIAPLVFAVFSVASIYIFFSVPSTDFASYYGSAAFFVIGLLASYHISRTAGFDSALSHFREVIIGSTNVGLTSIKKLEDTPPNEIAARVKTRFSFVGIAGAKFLRGSMQSNPFFRSNTNASDVRIMLMDPFSDDIVRLSKNSRQQTEYRRQIIATLDELAVLRDRGYAFDVRLYPKVPPLRLMIADNAVTAVSVYSADSTGWKNAQLLFDSKNADESLAPYFAELFDDLWERGLNFNLSLRAEALRGFPVTEKGRESLPPLGMVHGRFQPFHHEHLEYVLHGITHSQKCLIGITQPDVRNISACETMPHRGTPEANPFSFDERVDMIRISLESLGIEDKYYEIMRFDIDGADETIPTLLETTFKDEKPVQFVKVFGDWELSKIEVFKKHEFPIELLRDKDSQFSPKNVTGTLVRELISSERNWRDFVPAGTKAVVPRARSLSS